MQTRMTDAESSELLGVIVLLECAEQGTAESRSFMGLLTRDQRRMVRQELLKIADEYESEDS